MNAPLRPVEPVVLRPEPAPARGDMQPEAPAGGTLSIHYTQTRVLAGCVERLQRLPGVVRADRSELAEVFKRLRSQLLQRLQADGHSLLAVTSPRAIAGKSLTALNLALAMAAELDRTVLLVDADLSGGGLQSLLGLGDAPGLGEHLGEGTPLDALLVNPGVPRLVVLPGGRRGGPASAELLATRAMQRLGQEIKQRYPDRMVIIDMPPLLDTADAMALLPLADTTLLVAEEHGTALADLEEAAALLAPFNLVGSVLAPKPPALRPARLPWWRRWRGQGAAKPRA
ncbi:exopolysaccharide biosynthesis protein [Rubrivivax rivuli]|uniref:Exopolysaccharide biosynthesis protein n=1 Tax=Rubrivivax rivuli TaxID=1862385 RepID=A0A437REB5_9BURK|nr:exopolysaccharide biosynthesis protein [Rubrivivax rivuli]RVU45110.1 exopolysaccharide biosynthesis protein [Rubrivivax rivuli]